MKLIYGVGTNDADYVVREMEELEKNEDGSRNRKIIWACPYYIRWKDMLKRCYNKKHLAVNPCYTGCYVNKEWLLFSNFRAWMEKQDWEGKHLDKDLISKGNRQYGPDYCVFISGKLNLFIAGDKRSDNDLPAGVNKHWGNPKFYQVTCGSTYVGLYQSLKDACEAYNKRKAELAYNFILIETNQKVVQALLSRYEVKKYLLVDENKFLTGL